MSKNKRIAFSKVPTESLDIYINKREILSACQASLKEF